MSDLAIEPTPEDQEHARLAANDLLEVINRLAAEGMNKRIIATSLAIAAQDTVATYFGASAVVPWFLMQAAITQKMIEDN